MGALVGLCRAPATLAAVALIALGAGACGGDEGTSDAEGAPEGVPAAGPFTPPSGTPGVPEGASYDLDGTAWLRLTQARRFDVANDFIADNPSRCGDPDVGAVVAYTSDSYGYDFPPDIAAAEVLAEACDASRQS